MSESSILTFFSRLDGFAEAQVEVIELCLQSSSVCGDADALDSSKLDVLLEGMMSLLTHPSYEVRRYTRRRLPVFLRNNAMHTVRMRVIDAFYAMLKRRAGETVTPSPTAGDGVVVGVKPAESALLCEALGAIAVLEGTAHRGPLAASLLLPAHHLLLRRLDCWKKAVAMTSKHGVDKDDEWMADDAVDAIVGALREGMASDLESACRAALTLARRFDTEAIIDALASAVLDDLGDPALRAVTMHEVDVYNTPEGTLSSEHNKEDDEIAALNPNSKDYEEQLWEIKVRFTSPHDVHIHRLHSCFFW